MALSMGVIGCAQAAPVSPAKSAEASVNEGDREASWFVHKMRVCISNKTAESLSVQWGEYMQGDDGEYLPADQRNQTLGSDAFNCAVSHAYGGIEEAPFSLQDAKTKFELRNDVNDFWFSVRDVTYEGTRYFTLLPSEAQDFEATTSSGQRLTLRVTVKETLRKVGNVEAYPVDVRVMSASN